MMVFRHFLSSLVFQKLDLFQRKFLKNIVLMHQLSSRERYFPQGITEIVLKAILRGQSYKRMLKGELWQSFRLCDESWLSWITLQKWILHFLRLFTGSLEKCSSDCSSKLQELGSQNGKNSALHIRFSFSIIGMTFFKLFYGSLLDSDNPFTFSSFISKQNGY